MNSQPIIFAALAIAAGGATYAHAETLSILACPIVRDNEDAPCWLTEYKGKLYFLGMQQDLQEPFFPPQLKHQALIEGSVTSTTKCGGIVLDPVRVSVMPEVDLSCQTMLPAEGYHITGLRRGEGPDPGTLSAVNQAKARIVETFSPPFLPRTFTVYYDFDSSYMPSRSTKEVTRAWQYAQAAHAKSIKVRGFRGGALLTDGTKLVESADLVGSRSHAIDIALKDLGLDKTEVATENVTTLQRVNGREDYATRRVEIVVTP
jgi:hypothetical protein